MAILTDDLVVKYEGQRAGLQTTSSLVASGGFSVAGDLAAWTNTDDAPYLSCVLSITPASAPAANGYVFLYAQLLDISGTTDAPFPSGNFRHRSIGRFPINPSSGAQVVDGLFFLPTMYTQQQYQFAIENGLDVSINAGWDLIPDSQSVGPK